MHGVTPARASIDPVRSAPLIPGGLPTRERLPVESHPLAFWAMDRELLRGHEFDFLCIDRDGAVAVLSSAGYGPVPLSSLSRHEVETYAIESLSSRSPIADVRMADRKHRGDLSFWVGLSARGVYCYDWQHWSGPYRLVCTPSIKLAASQVAQLLPSGEDLLELPCRFAETAEIDLQAIGVNVAV